MNIPAIFARPFRRRLVSDSPALDRSFQPESAVISSPAPTTEPMPSADGLALLQARRLALLTEARRLKCLRQSKAASICEAELRRVTHEILNTRRRTDA